MHMRKCVLVLMYIHVHVLTSECWVSKSDFSLYHHLPCVLKLFLTELTILMCLRDLLAYLLPLPHH